MEYTRNFPESELKDLDVIQIKEEVKVEEDLVFCAVDSNSSIVESGGNIFQHIFKVEEAEGEFTAVQVCPVPPPAIPLRRSTRTIIPASKNNTELKKIRKIRKIVKEVETTDFYVYKCFICLKSFPTAKLVKTHLRYHRTDRRYVCLICKKVFSKMKEHMKTHTEEKSHECSVCNKRYKGRKGLESHMARAVCIRADQNVIKKTETIETHEEENNQAMDEV